MMKIINKHFFIWFAIYLVAMGALDFAFGDPFDWTTNIILSLLGAVWFGWLYSKNDK